MLSGVLQEFAMAKLPVSESNDENMHLFLTGLRGSGKTSVGQALSTLIEMPHVDLDHQIEQSQNRSIAAIFEADGEKGFRRIENRVLESLIKRQPSIISLGGGAIILSENRELIAQSGNAVWLKAPPVELARRLESDQVTKSQRPRLSEAKSVSLELQQMLDERAPWYREVAQFEVDASQSSPAEVAETIARWWKESQS